MNKMKDEHRALLEKVRSVVEVIESVRRMPVSDLEDLKSAMYQTSEAARNAHDVVQHYARSGRLWRYIFRQNFRTGFARANRRLDSALQVLMLARAMSQRGTNMAARSTTMMMLDLQEQMKVVLDALPRPLSAIQEGSHEVVVDALPRASSAMQKGSNEVGVDEQLDEWPQDLI
eukprot:evm.model.scf_3609.1 EVM.evm.TU.scf_3609.1   scf_3609:6763-8938(-)